MNEAALVESVVLSLGYATLEDYLRANATLTYRELCKALRPALSPIQMQLLTRRMLGAAGRNFYVVDSFVRCLRELVPMGWPSRGADRFQLAHAFAKWAANLHEEAARERSKQLWESMGNDSEIPEGWLPATFEDVILKKHLRDVL